MPFLTFINVVDFESWNQWKIEGDVMVFAILAESEFMQGTRINRHPDCPVLYRYLNSFLSSVRLIRRWCVRLIQSHFFVCEIHNLATFQHPLEKPIPERMPILGWDFIVTDHLDRVAKNPKLPIFLY